MSYCQITIPGRVICQSLKETLNKKREEAQKIENEYDWNKYTQIEEETKNTYRQIKDIYKKPAMCKSNSIPSFFIAKNAERIVIEQ